MILLIAKILLIIALIFICEAGVTKISNILNRRIAEARGETKVKKESKSLKTINTKMMGAKKFTSMHSRIENKLRASGNPFKLTPFTYYMWKVLGWVIATVLSFSSGYGFITACMLGVMGFFLVDLLHLINDADDNKKINKDLPDINDTLTIQTSAGVVLGLALTEIADIASLKRLRADLTMLAANINVTKNPDEALSKFVENYVGFYELEAFVLALQQALKTGKSKDILKGQSSILKENKLFIIEDETKRIDSGTVILLSLLLFVGAIAIVFFSFKSQISENLNQMFYNG